MSGNRKKAKRRTAKALQNLAKTPEKTSPIVTKTEKQRILVDELTVYKSEFTPYGKKLIERYVKAFNNDDDDDYVSEQYAEEESEEEWDDEEDEDGDFDDDRAK